MWWLFCDIGKEPKPSLVMSSGRDFLEEAMAELGGGSHCGWSGLCWGIQARGSHRASRAVPRCVARSHRSLDREAGDEAAGLRSLHLSFPSWQWGCVTTRRLPRNSFSQKPSHFCFLVNNTLTCQATFFGCSGLGIYYLECGSILNKDIPTQGWYDSCLSYQTLIFPFLYLLVFISVSVSLSRRLAVSVCPFLICPSGIYLSLHLFQTEMFISVFSSPSSIPMPLMCKVSRRFGRVCRCASRVYLWLSCSIFKTWH